MMTSNTHRGGPVGAPSRINKTALVFWGVYGAFVLGFAGWGVWGVLHS